MRHDANSDAVFSAQHFGYADIVSYLGGKKQLNYVYSHIGSSNTLKYDAFGARCKRY